jgi:hypothetical protein
MVLVATPVGETGSKVRFARNTDISVRSLPAPAGMIGFCQIPKGNASVRKTRDEIKARVLQLLTQEQLNKSRFRRNAVCSHEFIVQSAEGAATEPIILLKKRH